MHQPTQVFDTTQYDTCIPLNNMNIFLRFIKNCV